jgi:uncharacterized membrane protein
MAFCPKCGAPAEGRFCPSCGAPVSDTVAGSSASEAAPQAAPAQGLSENVACALCYLLGLITGILFLVLEPYSRNRNVRFHAFQSILFFVAIAVIWMVWTFVSAGLVSVPFLGAMLSALIALAISLGTFGCWLFLMWKAYNGQRFVLPIIGPLAEKQA